MKVFATDLRFELGVDEPTGCITADGLLLRFAAQGRYERYQCFLPPSTGRVIRDQVAPRILAHRLTSLEVFPLHAVEKQLIACPWDVFVSDLVSGAYIRDTFARRPFPIVWIPHLQGQRPFAHDPFLTLVSNVQPYDTVLYATRHERDLLQETWQRETERIERMTGARMNASVRMEPLGRGVDTVKFAPGDRFLERKALGLPADHFILLASNRSADATLPLLRVHDALRRARPSTLILLDRDAGRDRTQGIVSAMGLQASVRFRDRDPLDRLLRAGDVFLSLSDPDAPLLEALASGIPAIVPDGPEALEWPSDREVGVRIPTTGGAEPDTGTMCPEDLTQALGQLAVNIDSRRRLGEAARALAVRQFSWPRIVHRFEAVCREAVARCRSVPWDGPRADRPGLSIALCGYFATFRQNLSLILPEDAVLMTRSLGSTILVGTCSLSIYESLRPWIDVETVERILAQCLKRAELSTFCPPDPSEAAQRVRFHVLWMLKHGLLELVSPGRPPC